MATQSKGKGRYLAIVIIVLLAGFGIWKWRTPPEKAVPRPDFQTEREAPAGRFVGFVEDNGSYAWLGVPYAKPPLGSLRWKSPVAVERRESTLQAVKAASFCPQVGNLSIDIDSSLLGKPVGSEDCLYLNIWTSARSADDIREKRSRQPVMFWIHGGGNSIGQGANYSGKNLAAAHDLVVVTINYRLGPLGWFSHPALRATAATPADQSGNFGTLDIIMALRWVRENIAAFGGDPDNITIFGESAGAFNTISMLLSPRATGMFHRAIVQSGGLRQASLARAENFIDDPRPGHPFSSKEVVNLLLMADGKAGDREEARRLQEDMTDVDLETYLRSKSPADLLGVYEEFGLGMINFPNIIRDGTVLPSGDIRKRFEDASLYNPVPVMIGSNRDEYKLFMALNPDYVNIYLKLIYRVKDREHYTAVSAYLSDAWKASGVDQIAGQLSRTQGDTVFAYRFDWDEEPVILGNDLPFLLGAAHSLEIPFVFMNRDIMPAFKRFFTDDNQDGWNTLSSSMASYWAEFAYTGAPGKGRNDRLPEWQPWQTNGGSFIVLDTSTDQGIRMSSHRISMQQLKTRILAETAITEPDDLCGMYYNLFGDPNQFISDTRLWDESEFLNLGESGCNGFFKNRKKQ